ncbi:hypothetical protein OHT76_39245 [Streptomyces sp. NBC_00287]|uniref:hypothetical protein n=1 Tax=Streptomyces sp. NBC_00287 TaxID=2975702 RepID=UPI002E2A4C89|nr:hypothetical protein [Streptomyces sp. NBC_00287]
MTGMVADNAFSIEAWGIQVDLPHRDDGEWTARDIVDWAAANTAWHEKKKCATCKGCFVVAEGTLVEVPDGADPMDIRFVAPSEVKRRIAENRLWIDAP